MELLKETSNYFFGSAGDVCQACQPLFDNSLIDYFDYNQFYDDGSCLILTTHPEFHCEYLKHDLYVTQQEVNQFVATKRIAFMSGNVPLSVSGVGVKKMNDSLSLAQQFNVMHKLYIVYQADTCIKIVGFGVTGDRPAIYEYFINMVDMLEKFIVYFENQAYDLIRHAHKNSIVLPDYLHDITPVKGSNVMSESCFHIDFIPEILPIKLGNKNIALTRKEAETLVLYARGYSVKEVSSILAIAPKTVDNRLYKIKKTIGPMSKGCLKRIMHDNKLFLLFGYLFP